MIELTKINGDRITINADDIEFIETTHDTIISMHSGKKISVQETTETVTEKVIEYKRKISQ